MANEKDMKMPFNIEEEQIVLGIMLCDEIAMVEALSDLNEDDFYEGYSENKIIFNAIRKVYEKGFKVGEEISFLIEELRLTNDLETIGGVEYINFLLGKVTTTLNLQDHIKIIKDCKSLRDILKLIQHTEYKYNNFGAGDIQEFIDEFSTKIRIINEKRRISKFLNTTDLINRFKEEMPNTRRVDAYSDLAYNAITTGFDELDRSINGFKRGEYIIIAGRPSMGKTTFALNSALRSALRTGRTVGIFSLEMPATSLLQRFLSIESRIPLKTISTGTMDGTQEVALESTYERLSEAKVYIDDSSQNTVMDIIAKATRLKSSHPDLSMIMIDYIGLISGGPKVISEQEKTQDISRQIKGLAKTLDIPVVVLSQLSRNTEGRIGNRPVLSDLRSSGSLEQDADIVILLYREGYYELEKSKIATNNPKKQADSGIQTLSEQKRQYEQLLNEKGQSLMELIVAKNRSGRMYNNVTLLFDLNRASFDPIADSEMSEINRIFGLGDSRD